MIVDSFNRTYHREVEGDRERVDFVRGSNVRLWKNDISRGFETHWHSAVEIVSPIKNIYTIAIHDQKYVLNPGEIIVIPSGELHETIAPSDGERYILVCDGRKPDGGHYLDITGVSYESADNTVVITVKASKDNDVTTDAYTYPSCSVIFDRIPNKVQVKYEDGTVIEYGGVINDTQVWGLNIDIDENYTAVFDGGVYRTYIYEMDDGKYRYIHVYKGTSTQHPGQKEFVQGSGIADTIYGVETVCKTYSSFGIVIVKGDEGNEITAEEYIKMHEGDDV